VHYFSFAVLRVVVQVAAMSNTASDERPTDDDGGGQSETIGVRLPAHLIEALRQKRSAMARATPGAAITLSDAVRSWLLAGRDADR